MKKTIFILCLVLAQSICAQITFVVNELPENHDFNNDVYISGNFESWSGGKESYKLEKTDKTYSITLPLTENVVLYKFTMGSWDLVERDAEGEQTDNRTYNRKKEQDTIFAKIVSWDEASASKEGQSTASKNVQVLSEDINISELNRKRRVWMYLPPDYHSSNERYPVLYIHDGQNVFDNKTSYSGEWEVDETLDRLFRLHNFRLIVVAIDNAGDKRLNEYSPWGNKRFGEAEGEAYINFITNTLKPHIDTTFRTLKDAKHTGIMGSSMGGLISHYAALEHPNVFGKAGVFSPSFWYSEDAYNFTSNHSNTDELNMYYLVGGSEGDTMKPDMVKMIDLMKSKGFDEHNIQQKIVEEGTHSEKFWRSEFEEAVRWLFPEAIKKREFERLKQTDNGVEIDVTDGSYLIEFYSSEIVGTTFIPKGEALNNESHAVIIKPQNVEVIPLIGANESTFSTDGISVTINEKPFQISYFYKGEEITSEKLGYQKNDEFETIQFNLKPDEILYGGGARALGMNRRGHRLELYNKADYGYETESKLMNYTMPIVLSSKQYMIHFDNAPIGYLDLDSKDDNTLTYETISGRKTYQVIVGNSWLDLIDNYTDLTGKQPMPPRWALGNFSSRFGYHSQKEVEETVEKFKKASIPLDAVIIDIYWFGKDIQGHMGNLEFLRDSFPNPKQMIRSLKDKGIKTVLVTEPFVLTTSKRWQEAVNKNILAKDSIGNPFTFNFYFGNTGLIDVYSQQGKSWFWNIYKGLAELGVKGVWGDLGEPEVHPKGLLHATGTADEVHNTYGHDWARLVYEGYKKDFPNQRPFILMRSGSSGSQRFGLIPWSGDVNRTWGGLRSQTEIALQMSMQGLAYMHSDLGGFAGANLDDELYARWLQYGVFQPIYRPHAQEEVPAEPVFREERTKEFAKQSIEMRYKLLPYNYTLAFENNQSGAPLMRPVFFEEPNNKEQLISATTYLWGNDFLITPIVNPGVEEKDVYFPSNGVWFDFYTDQTFKGGQTKRVKAYNNSIPTYVRAGAFIPIANLVQSTDYYSASTLDLHYYHDNTVAFSKGYLYNDDGISANAFEKGAYEILRFESEFESNVLEIELEAETGSQFESNKKEIRLVVHNMKTAPKQVKINNKRTTYNWDESTNIISVPLGWDTNNEIEINIKLKK